MKKLFFLAAMAVVMGSCSKQVFKQHTARTTGIPARVEAMVTAADLDVAETKATGVCTTEKLGKKAMETEAIADALRKTGADVLVEPQFTHTYKKMQLISVEVTGYPARYKEFRKATREDLETLNTLLHPNALQPVVLVPAMQSAK